MERVVTSFGPDGWQLYGQRFLETYVDHHDKPLLVYIEGEKPPFEHPLVTYRDLFKVEGIAGYLENAGRWSAARGFLWGEQQYNYRYDTFKFSRKSFAQIDAASINGDWLYWIDADVEFSGALPFPYGGPFMYYLGRPDWHSCASFVGWNLRHPVAGEFWKRYWLLHVTGTIFCLPEWHDSFVLDWLRGQMKFDAVNLAAGTKPLKGPANVFDAVFPMAHHKKGNLKHVSSADRRAG